MNSTAQAGPGPLRLPLFRPEALQAQQSDGHGVPLSAPAPGAWWLTGAVVLLLSAALAAATWGEYTRKEHVAGVLVPSGGTIKLFAPQTGTLVEIAVTEGTRVRRGQTLAVVSSDRATAASGQALGDVQREMRARRDSLLREAARLAEIDALSQATARQRLQSLERQSEQAQEQLELQRSRVAGAQRQLERQRLLRAADFVSEATLQQKEDELTDQRAQLASLLRSAAVLEADLGAARSELASSRLHGGSTAALLQRQVSEVEQQLTEAEERRSAVLLAPVDGTVTTLQADVGQNVGPAQALLTLLPASGGLEARLLVPSRAAGFIHPGQQVALRYQAFPYERYGHALGQVVQVGQVVVSPEEAGLASLAGAAAEPGYRVTVRLPEQDLLADGRALPLRAGMALDADIHLERRRLIDWLFEPLLAIRGRL